MNDAISQIALFLKLLL